MYLQKFLIFFIYFIFLCDTSISKVRLSEKDNNEDIEISSNEFSINTKEKISTLLGNAEVKFGKNTFKADKIIIKGDINLKKPEKINAIGNVIFDNNVDISIKSDRCEYNDNIISFNGNILIEDKNIGKINAEFATYNIYTKKIDITSKKKVRLTINDKTSKKIKKKIIK